LQDFFEWQKVVSRGKLPATTFVVMQVSHSLAGEYLDLKGGRCPYRHGDQFAVTSFNHLYDLTQQGGHHETQIPSSHYISASLDPGPVIASLWQGRTDPHTSTAYGDARAAYTYAHPHPADGHTDARPPYRNIHARPTHTYPSAVGPGSDNRIH